MTPTPEGDKPAFPHHTLASGFGLTKREYYKAAALQGLLASGALSMQVISQGAEKSGVRPTQMLATIAGDMADEMLAEDLGRRG